MESLIVSKANGCCSIMVLCDQSWKSYTIG